MLKDNILFKGFNKKESGTLLLILAFVLILFSFKNFLILFSPATNLNIANPSSLTEGTVVSITPADNYGLCYYDTSYGVFTEMYEGSKEYGRAYLTIIPDSISGNSIVGYAIESSDKSIQNKLESISNNGITNLTFKGRLVAVDQDRLVDENYTLMMKIYSSDSAINAGLTQFYISVDDPTNEILMVITGIISAIVGTVLLMNYKKEHPDEDEESDDNDESNDDNNSSNATASEETANE